MISRQFNLPVSLRIALRELRGGLSGFRIFMACLILGVATIAAVASLTRAIEEGLEAEGQSILGGDIEVSEFRKKLPDDAVQWLASKGELLHTAKLRTMARTTAGNSTLVELRAVGMAYPMYGTLKTTPQLPTSALLSKQEDEWGTAIESALADRLNVQVGDTLKFGSITTRIRAVIDVEPDKANLGFQLGPTVMIARQALDETGLVVVGSLISFDYKLRLDASSTEDIKAFRDEIEEAFPGNDWRIRDRTTSAPGMRRFIDRMGMFLTLVGLTALVVGGVGVGNAVRGYMDRKTKTIATLKILGADGSTIFKVYFIQILLIGIISIIIGVTVGAFLPAILANFLPDTLPVSPEQGLYPKALILAAAYGLLITIAFTAWPLGKARDLPPVRLFRALVSPESSRPRGIYIALIILAIGLVAALAIGLANQRFLALGFIGGAIVTLGLLRFTSYLIERGAAKAPRPKNALVRMAVANLHRPGAATGAVVISLGLGLTLFSSLALIESNLEARLQEEVPMQAPAFFFLDIQANQIDDFRATTQTLDGVSDLMTVPNLRGRIIKLNDTMAEDAEVDPEYRWVLNGDRGLSYDTAVPNGSTLTEGDWWPEGYSGPSEISFGAKEAKGLGLKVGDHITLMVLGREITARIRSLRDINWGTMGFNFVMMFDPNTLKGAPHTYMATIKASGEAEKIAHRTLTRKFTNITAVRMKEVIESVNVMLAQISIAVRATAIVAIIAGMLVLAGAIAAGFKQRVYESVILKVVGAVRSQILRAYMLEYLLIGFVVAAIALGLGGLAGWVVVTQVWKMTFTWMPIPMIITLAVSLIVTLTFGIGSSLKALSARPNEVLRSQ